jgi:hypothetical protein
MHIRLLFACLLLIVSFIPVLAQEGTPINLIAFKYNGMEESSEIIQWEVNSPASYSAVPAEVSGILVGSSIFNPNTGDYIARVTHTDNTSGIYKYNINTSESSFNEASSFFNGSSECDMQTGYIYNYDGNALDEVELNKYNPQTNVVEVVGTFDFLPNTSFFPDGSCFDSNLGIYYFVILDTEGRKLVAVDVNNPVFSYTVTLLTGMSITGNIGLEFSNETNQVYCIYSSYNPDTETSTFVVGSIATATGEISVLNVLNEIGGYQFYNRTFDQATKKLMFVAYDLSFTTQYLYLYDMDSNTYETRLLPADVIVEIECNNIMYSELKYGALNTPSNTPEKVVVYADNATQQILVSANLAQATYCLYNTQGAKLLSGAIDSSLAIEATGLSAGVYILSLTTEKKRVNLKVMLR